MSVLPQPALIHYNGITFNDPNTETTELTATPVPDGSGRTVSHIVYRITLRTVITAEQSGFASTDLPLAVARQRLSQYGGEFRYQNNGFGNLIINTPPNLTATANAARAAVFNNAGLVNAAALLTAAETAAQTAALVAFNSPSGARDVVWGPKPRILRWAPLGAQNACELTWTVEVAIPECDNARFDGAANWMEFCYEVGYNTDASGYSTRTYNGYVKVPQTRVAQTSRTIRYSADEARELIYPQLIPGFKRTPGDFKLSMDKCRLDFSGIRDDEKGPNYPPAGVIEVSASHSMTSDTFFGAIWKGTMSATYELSRNVGRDAALGHFLTLFTSRLDVIRQAPVPAKGILGVLQNEANKGKLVISHPYPTGIQVSEPEIYGRKGAAFTANYTVGMPVDSLIQSSGMWRPVPGNDPKAWTNSFNAKDWGPRGNAGLRFRSADDAIIDLCIPPQPIRLTPTAKPPPLVARPGSTFSLRADPSKKSTFSLQANSRKPPDEASWLHYVAWIEYSEVDEVVELKPLPPPQLDILNAAVAGLARGASVATGYDIYRPVRFTPPVFQRRAITSGIVFFRGYAIRVGAKIPRPRLVSVGKPPVAVIEANREGNGFSQALVAEWFGVSVYAASWNLRYVHGPAAVDFEKGQERLPANPFAQE